MLGESLYMPSFSSSGGPRGFLQRRPTLQPGDMLWPLALRCAFAQLPMHHAEGSFLLA
jgi:hypothetical protein